MSNHEDSDSALSPSSVSSISSFDVSLTEQLRNCRMDTPPTCRPALYESSNPLFDSSQSGQYLFYNVYSGDQPGCYKDWADASGRVTNVKGSRHKGYKSWAKALSGWRQNCRAYHHHPPGFLDGTLYSPSPRPETPPPMTPPPSRHNIEHFQAQPSTQTPMNHTSDELHPPMSRTPNKSRPQYWAIHSSDFVGVVSSTTQAQMILDNAAACDDPAILRPVNNLSEAEEWLRQVG
ncbi:hypothetical protein F5878DRAFT_668251 [Lentinula raphanica]|uniref:Ribonuclease H1 N-terminal domain-containing protein n=1 Tax=Lentinula raphanica TaxID=153919 RepID=A0AA38NUH4_9AGAR|nr:hypothetical protein F5878DRAFT_668251 [Lentinula raphanica]